MVVAWIPGSTAEWALAISWLALAISGITFLLTEWRRRERIVMMVDNAYTIDRQRDQYLYPTTVTANDARSGERAVRIAVKYHGRHSLAIRNLFIEYGPLGLLPHNLPERKTLYDGQESSFLVLERDRRLDDITQFVLETESHGNRVVRMRSIVGS